MSEEKINKRDSDKKEPIDRERSDKESNDELSEEQLQKVAGGRHHHANNGSS